LRQKQKEVGEAFEDLLQDCIDSDVSSDNISILIYLMGAFTISLDIAGDEDKCCAEIISQSANNICGHLNGNGGFVIKTILKEGIENILALRKLVDEVANERA